MNKRKPGTRLLLLLLAALLAVALMGCKKTEPAATEPAATAPAAAEKTVTLHVTFPDGAEKDYSVTTGAEMLGQALLDEGLVEGEMQEYGLFIQSVDGVTADAGAGQYWVFTKGGEWVTTGADMTPIADGDGFEFFIYQ